ncbi:alpha/beta fold hydrolase [Soonwooa sp.]|uniref:alpha/beta fold hydrolase n=1 Tax=Soonwooa sp. TaxID=1938592 RepID=UPI0028A718F6|nr:alpha/beta fold hydrolase [Soonwooa sp.]
MILNSVIKFFIFILGFILSVVMISAQTEISGQVFNVDKKALAYVNISVKTSESATVTDKNGLFKLIFEKDPKTNDSIVFSTAGFVDKQISFQDLKENPNVILDQKQTDLNEIVVKSIKLNDKLIGEKKRPMLTFTKFFNQNTPTAEQGSVFQVYSTTKIKAYNFYIMPSSRFEELTLKLNIYSLKNGLPHQNLLTENIIYQTKTTGWQCIDFSNYRLLFKNEKEIAITLQLVDYKKLANEDFVFGVSAKKKLGQNLWYRYQSQGNWERATGQYIANIEVAYNKTPQEKEIATSTETLDNLDDEKAKEKLAIMKYKNEAQNSNFGRNKSGEFLVVKDAKIYYETYGEGPVLVLLHGNGGSITDFYKQIPFFEKHFKVIAIDTRGQGRSTNLSKQDYSYEGFADDLFEVVKQLNLSKIKIIGWSDGGNTGLIFAKNHPELIDKLVTIGANLYPEGVDESLLNEIKNDFENEDNTDDKRLLKLMLTQPKLKPEDLNLIKIPTLVVAGETDIIKKEHTDLIQKSLPTSELLIVKKAGHYVPFEQPKILNNEILKFLTK